MSRKEILTHASVPVKASLIIMGTGQLMYKQWVKGMLYLAVFAVLMLIFNVLLYLKDKDVYGSE